VTARDAPPERPGAPGGKREQNRRRRIQELETAGLGLFLERGIDRVTVDEIARAGGTAKGNFYRYFDSKQELLESIVRPLGEGILEAMGRCEQALSDCRSDDDDAALHAAYRALAVELIPITLGHRDVVRLYLQESRAPAVGDRAPLRALADEVKARSIDLTEFAVDRGLLRVPDPRVSALAVVGAVEALALTVLEGDLDAPPPIIAQTLITLVLDGIRAA
jgi:AcrR family transcriptional regulator